MGGPSMKKGSQLCLRLGDPWAWSLGPSSPKPGGGTAWAALSQQPVTQEETALGPQTVKCQLQASGTRLV